MNSALKVASYAKKHRHVQQSVAIIEQAIERFGLSKLCVSFNGGKDCTVVLHLLQATIQNLGLNDHNLETKDNKSISHNNNNNNHNPVDGFSNKLLAFYFKSNDMFEEEEQFVNQAIVTYNLRLAQYSCASLKDSLNQFKSEYPKVDGIFMGTRMGDLKQGQTMSSFETTDPSWPPFTRINPILEWSYQQVWDFIRQLEVPYCDLYNKGYSSFGTKGKSQRNMSLLRHDPEGRPYYQPAWCLADHQDERYSRD